MLNLRSLLILVSSVLSLLTLVVGSSIAQDKPNIVWIMSEDNSKHYLKLFDSTGAGDSVSPPHRVGENAR